MKVVNNKIAVKPAPPEEKTAGGLIIPDSAKQSPHRGEVVAVGSGTLDESMQVEVGDIVFYDKRRSQEVTHDGADYIIVNQEDVLLILN